MSAEAAGELGRGVRVVVDEPVAERKDASVGLWGGPRAGVIDGVPESITAEQVGELVGIRGTLFIADRPEIYWPVQLDSGDHVVAASYLLRREDG